MCKASWARSFWDYSGIRIRRIGSVRDPLGPILFSE